MEPYGDFANVYRSLGWQGTLPLPEGKKHSPPKGYTGGGRQHPEQEQVAEWINRNPLGNICLRLSDVETAKAKHGRTIHNKLPMVYGGNTVDGWELIGIDIDNYTKAKGEPKRGFDELRELEAEYGALPATVLSSARWPEPSAATQFNGCIAVYLVPKGYRYMGKAANCIDIVQKRHRYMVVWPSTNPEASGARYIWRWGKPSYSAAGKRAIDLRDYTPGSSGRGSSGPGTHTGAREADATGIPPLCDVAVLPERWFDYLSRRGQVESEDPISNLTDDDLWNWAVTEFRYAPDSKPYANVEPKLTENGQVAPCKWMREAVEKYIGELDASADSHPKMTTAHWRLFSLATEGHSGLAWALTEYHSAWVKHVVENRGGAPEDLHDEITRSVVGALSKIEPNWKNQTVPDDTCIVIDEVAVGEWADRVNGWGDGIDGNVTEHDHGGYGPVVGKMLDNSRVENICKPAEHYERHDYGNGQHFVDLYGGNVKYVGARKSWILWDGARWHRDSEDRLIGLAYQAVKDRQTALANELTLSAALDPDDKMAKAEAKAWSSWARRSGDMLPVKNALLSARGAYVGNETANIPANWLDGNPTLLGCANGIIDLMAVDEHGQPDVDVRKPRRSDYVTYNTGVEYMPWKLLVNSDGVNFEGFQIWQEYLDYFMPDLKLRHFIQKVLGHCIIGENPEKKIVFLFGQRDTGKSTLLGAISGALGDYYGTIDLGLFKNRDLNPALVRAVPMRVTGMSEAEDSSKTGAIDAGVIKRLTGNDMVTAELKYSNEIFEGRPQFTTIIACNNPPTINGGDDALMERLLVLPLDRQVNKEVRKYDRQKEIARISGVPVLSWLIEGWINYRKEGLDSADWPAAVRKSNRIFKANINSVQQYIDEHLWRADDTEEGRNVKALAYERAAAKDLDEPTAHMWMRDWCVESKYLYQHFVKTMRENNVLNVPSAIQFGRELKVGPTLRRKMKKGDKVPQAVYCGLKWKAKPEEVAQAQFNLKN